MNERSGADAYELGDAEAGHALKIATLFGIPAVYALVLIIGLVAGASSTDALVTAIWPAIVGGPFFGTIITLGLVVHRHEHPTAVVPLRPAATSAATVPRAA